MKNPGQLGSALKVLQFNPRNPAPRQEKGARDRRFLKAGAAGTAAAVGTALLGGLEATGGFAALGTAISIPLVPAAFVVGFGGYAVYRFVRGKK